MHSMEKPWKRHYTDTVPGSLEYPGMVIDELLRNSSRDYPENTALTFAGNRIRYRELDQLVDKFTSALFSLGIRKGDRIALLLPNCPQMVIAFYSIFRLGAIAVPANPLYQEREIAYQIKNSGAETLITLDLLYSRISSVKDQTNLKNIIVTSIKEYLPPLKKMLYPLYQLRGDQKVKIDHGAGMFSFKDMIKAGSPDVPSVAISPEDTAILQYSGGTTGVSKGAELTHRNIISNTLQMCAWYFIIKKGEEVILSILPLFHTYGIAVCMNLSIATGSCSVLVPRFVPKDVLKAIQDYRVTFFPGIPGIYAALNNYKDIKKWDISSVNYCVSGSAPLPIKVIEEFEERTGGVIIEGYGLTESSPVTHSNPVHTERKVGSIGLPMPDTDCKIVDIEDGENEVLPGESGELCIKGPQVMKGYWDMPSETAIALKDGWLHTGDIARIDDDGYFYILDRKKDMIISEGFNIYPNEIDEVVLEHPKILDAAAVGVPDRLRGEKVILFVVLKENEVSDRDEILAFCKERLAKYKVPKKVEFRDELPKTPVGKVLRRVLREEAVSGEV
jgi:long-chain acyl-CoA synthetase